MLMNETYNLDLGKIIGDTIAKSERLRSVMKEDNYTADDIGVIVTDGPDVIAWVENPDAPVKLWLDGRYGTVETFIYPV